MYNNIMKNQAGDRLHVAFKCDNGEYTTTYSSHYDNKDEAMKEYAKLVKRYGNGNVKLAI